VSRSLPVTGNTELTQPENRAYYPALDGLRAIAFLLVFFGHYGHMPWGWAGVDFFFVLSGFLITGILYDSRDDTFRVRNFYVRRTLRIFPLYYGIMVVLLLAEPIMHWQWSWRWLVWPAYLGNFAMFLHPYVYGSPLQRLAALQLISVHTRSTPLQMGHFWSLCVEEQFYLLWPWLVFLLRDRRKLLWICIAMQPLCLAARLLGHHYLPLWMLQNEVLYRATPFRLDALLLGGMLALWLRGPHAQTLLRFARTALPVLLTAIALGVLLTPLRHLRAGTYPYPTGIFTWGLTLIDLLAALVLLVALQPGSWVYRLLQLRPLRWLGLISYGAYVLHDVFHIFYFHAANILLPQHVELATTTFGLIFTVLLAWLSYRFYESPFLNLKERWTRRA